MQKLLRIFDLPIDVSMCGILSEKGLNQCPICFSPLSDQPCFQSGCSHVFHLKCIQEWKKTSPKCPVCRSNILDSLVGTGKLLDREIYILQVSSIVKCFLEAGALNTSMTKVSSAKCMVYPPHNVTIATFPHEVLVFDHSLKLLKLEGIIPTPISRLREPPFIPQLGSSALKYPGARLSDVIKALNEAGEFKELTKASIAYIGLVLLKASQIMFECEIESPLFTIDDVFLSYSAVCWILGFKIFPLILLKGLYLSKDGMITMPKDSNGTIPVSVLPRPIPIGDGDVFRSMASSGGPICQYNPGIVSILAQLGLSLPSADPTYSGFEKALKSIISDEKSSEILAARVADLPILPDAASVNPQPPVPPPTVMQAATITTPITTGEMTTTTRLYLSKDGMITMPKDSNGTIPVSVLPRPIPIGDGDVFRSMASSGGPICQYNPGIVSILAQLGLSLPSADPTYSGFEKALKSIISDEKSSEILAARVADLPILPDAASVNPQPPVPPPTVMQAATITTPITTGEMTTTTTTAQTEASPHEPNQTSAGILVGEPSNDQVYGSGFRSEITYPLSYTYFQKRKDFFKRGFYEGYAKRTVEEAIFEYKIVCAIMIPLGLLWSFFYILCVNRQKDAGEYDPDLVYGISFVDNLMPSRWIFFIIYCCVTTVNLILTYLKVDDKIQAYNFSTFGQVGLWVVELILYLCGIVFGWIGFLLLSLRSNDKSNSYVHNYMGPMRFTIQLLLNGIEIIMAKYVHSRNPRTSMSSVGVSCFIFHLILSYSFYIVNNLFFVKHLYIEENMSGVNEYNSFMFLWVSPALESAGMMVHRIESDDGDSEFGSFLSHASILRRNMPYYFFHYYIIDYATWIVPLVAFAG
ncbi:hypothetical protein ADUPG1_010096 [Aduncisulcus paluster]|uniref:RING-type domain-containing protein n=1 Tax=Aduncisulcus paluster TaxID=2918883 RepID=A0ABQ5KXU7_9EUKA|nr:hypothetical protein ADUPG1_010096 [Aduncisulcus paluster]